MKLKQIKELLEQPIFRVHFIYNPLIDWHNCRLDSCDLQYCHPIIDYLLKSHTKTPIRFYYFHFTFIGYFEIEDSNTVKFYYHNRVINLKRY